MISILTLDPGESTGWSYRDGNGLVIGGTAGKLHTEVAALILTYMPDVVVIERFNLYPQMAKSLSWNSFYPCEVIGVVRYVCMVHNIPLVEQAPSVKKYFGGFKPDWDKLKELSKEQQGNALRRVTEHTKDAYMHLKYFELNGLKKFE